LHRACNANDIDLASCLDDTCALVPPRRRSSQSSDPGILMVATHQRFPAKWNPAGLAAITLICGSARATFGSPVN
jgi:hypothetical protein